MYFFFRFAVISLFSFVCLSYGTSISSPTLTLLNNNYETHEPIYEYINNTEYDYNTYEYNVSTTIKHAYQYGIRVVRLNSIKAEQEKIYGSYVPITKEIILYNAPSELCQYDSITDTTLKHELIHAIQHCRGEWDVFRHLLDKNSLLFCIYNKLVNVDFIDKYYSDADYFIEIDAYCLENLVTYDIIDLLLDRYCGVL